MTIKELMNEIKNDNSNILDVKRIIEKSLNISNIEMIANSERIVSDKEYIDITDKIKQLNNGKPLQYIINEQYFMDNKFYVDESVLIPQSDTEVLVEKTIEIVNEMAKLKENESKIKILDLCTGSGAIAISLKSILKDKVEIHASDISKEALDVAQININNILKQKDAIDLIKSDMFDNIKDEYDLIVSNPPYIESSKIKELPKDVQMEPKLALDGGEDGLRFYKIINNNINKHLKKYGYLIMEIGFNQKESLMKLYPEAICIKDYANNDRVIIWKNN